MDFSLPKRSIQMYVRQSLCNCVYSLSASFWFHSFCLFFLDFTLVVEASNTLLIEQMPQEWCLLPVTASSSNKKFSRHNHYHALRGHTLHSLASCLADSNISVFYLLGGVWLVKEAQWTEAKGIVMNVIESEQGEEEDGYLSPQEQRHCQEESNAHIESNEVVADSACIESTLSDASLSSSPLPTSPLIPHYQVSQIASKISCISFVSNGDASSSSSSQSSSFPDNFLRESAYSILKALRSPLVRRDDAFFCLSLSTERVCTLILRMLATCAC